MGDPQQTASAERARTLFTVSPELSEPHILTGVCFDGRGRPFPSIDSRLP